MTSPDPVVSAIHIAPGARLAMKAVERVIAEAGLGLVGDRYHGSRNAQVTVQSASSLAQAADVLGCDVDPSGTRRNVTVSCGEIPHRAGARITLGDVVLEVVRAAPPCRVLDERIAPGAGEALRGRSGSRCRVITGGELAVGDRVEFNLDRHNAAR